MKVVRFKYFGEAFDKPLPFNREYHDKQVGSIYNFKTQKGQKGRVEFVSNADKKGNPKHITIDFLIGDSTKRTGTGEAFEIFATVKKIVDEYLTEFKDSIKIVEFSAKKNEEGGVDANVREKLYTRYANYLAKKYKFKIKTRAESKWQGSIQKTWFTLSK